jgi:hypothetical protein
MLATNFGRYTYAVMIEIFVVFVSLSREMLEYCLKQESITSLLTPSSSAFSVPFDAT